MYQIYINKEEGSISVQKLSKRFNDGFAKECVQRAEGNIGEIIAYNDYYSFCAIRKNLLEYGRQIKQEWIDELKTEIKKIEAIKI